MLKIDDENNIYLTRGDTATLDVYITDEDGVSYVMAADDRLIFSVRRLAGKGEVLISKVVSSPTIYIDTADTKCCHLVSISMIYSYLMKHLKN